MNDDEDDYDEKLTNPMNPKIEARNNHNLI